MEQQGLTRRDLEEIVGPRTRIAEVLNRKRGLSITMIRRLHERLGISADVLIRPSRKKRGNKHRPTRGGGRPGATTGGVRHQQRTEMARPERGDRCTAFALKNQQKSAQLPACSYHLQWSVNLVFSRSHAQLRKGRLLRPQEMLADIICSNHRGVHDPKHCKSAQTYSAGLPSLPEYRPVSPDRPDGGSQQSTQRGRHRAEREPHAAFQLC